MKIKIALSLLLVFALIQFIPVQRNETSPVVHTTFIEEVYEEKYLEMEKTLRTSCYDCHSNNTVYPWYNKIAPVSWYLAKHVRNGKKKLNFDAWQGYTAKEKSHLKEEIIEVLEENEMPLWSYTLIHQHAKLSPEEKDLIINYFKVP